jgi:hypothetical protein
MAIYSLDSDILSLYRRDDPEVKRRVALVPDEIVTTVINVEEAINGWYKMLRSATAPAALEQAYARLGPPSSSSPTSPCSTTPPRRWPGSTRSTPSG